MEKQHYISAYEQSERGTHEQYRTHKQKKRSRHEQLKQTSRDLLKRLTHKQKKRSTHEHDRVNETPRSVHEQDKY